MIVSILSSLSENPVPPSFTRERATESLSSGLPVAAEAISPFSVTDTPPWENVSSAGSPARSLNLAEIGIALSVALFFTLASIPAFTIPAFTSAEPEFLRPLIVAYFSVKYPSVNPRVKREASAFISSFVAFLSSSRSVR